MKDYEIRNTRVTVLPVGDPIFSEMATHIEIDDEAGGEFIKVTQQSMRCDAQQIAIDANEWPMLRNAINKMFENCRKEEQPLDKEKSE